MKPPQYHIIETTQDHVLIQDVGPWDKHATITNAAEQVVAELSPLLFDGRRLEYIDSEGRRDQILVRDGRFFGFAPLGRPPVTFEQAKAQAAAFAAAREKANPPQEPPAPLPSDRRNDF